MDKRLILTSLIFVCIAISGCEQSQNDGSQMNHNSSNSGWPSGTSEFVEKLEVNRRIDDFTGVGELNSPAFATLSGTFVIPWDEARTTPAGSLHIRFRTSNSDAPDARIITKPIEPRLRFIIDGERFVEPYYEIREIERVFRDDYVIEFRVSEQLLNRILTANDARGRLDFTYRTPKAFGTGSNEFPFRSEFKIDGRSRKSLTALLKEAGKLDTAYERTEHADNWHGYVESGNAPAGNDSAEPRRNAQNGSHRATDYDEFLIFVEALFPELNPDSVAYDEEIVSRIIEEKEFYDQQGYDDVQALSRAFEEHFSYNVYSEFNQLKKEAALQQDISERCVLERPMSRSDYRKCSLPAPQYRE